MTNDTLHPEDPNYQKPPKGAQLTAANWNGYWLKEYEGDMYVLNGLEDATDRITAGLERLVETAQSFEELKGELLKFIQERKAFSQDVTEKRYNPSREQYGFPSWDEYG